MVKAFKVCVLACTNFTIDARVLRSVRALRDSGFLVDPVLLARMSPPSKVGAGSYGITYEYIGPQKMPRYHLKNLTRELLAKTFRTMTSQRRRETMSVTLVVSSLVIAVLAWTLASVQLALLGIVALLIAHIITSGPWVKLMQRIRVHIVQLFPRLTDDFENGMNEQLIAHLRRTRPDIVLMHDMIPLKYVDTIRETLKVPLVWDAHEYYPEVAGLASTKSVEYQELLTQVQHKLDGFIVVNPMIEAVYHERFSAMPRSIVMTNACRVPPLITYDGRLHAAAGIDRSKRVLLYQGGMSPHRGLKQLAEAAPLFPPDWVLVLMGSGIYLPELEKRACQESITHREGPHTVIIRPAPHEELLHWTSGASVAAILYEPTCLNQELASPNKIWEYAAAGVPILTHDLPFVRSKIEAFDAGWVLPLSPTAEAVAHFISTLGSEELARKAANARLLAEKEDGRYEEEKLVKYLGSFQQ